MNDFVDNIDDKFWDYRLKKYPFKDTVNFRDIDRDKFLSSLANKLRKKEHYFSPPNYYYFPKEKGILRKQSVYSLEDTFIYYHCVKEIEEPLVDKINEIDHVFGGFRFTKDLRLTEQDLDDIMEPPDYSSGFAPMNFRQQWKEYDRLARRLYNRSFDHYIRLDVAHFYDDINLEILEQEIRDLVQGKLNVINNLFHFLRFSERTGTGYEPSSVGIPQEPGGEMSRLLANFYLHKFDYRFRTKLENLFDSTKDYQYTRYSDDMWVCFNGSEERTRKIIQRASLELEKLNLHINEKKLEVMNQEGFKEYWKFETWNQIFQNKNDEDILLEICNELWKKGGRWFSPAKYILKVLCSEDNNPGTFFATRGEAKSFLEKFITQPQMAEGLNREHKTFLTKLINHFSLRDRVMEILKGGSNHYPSLEYFLLNLLIGLPDRESMVDFFINGWWHNKSRTPMDLSVRQK